MDASDASTMLERTKARLIEAAEKEYGKIEPCNIDPFTIFDGVLYFWFNLPDNSTHFTHTHLIHENTESEK